MGRSNKKFKKRVNKIVCGGQNCVIFTDETDKNCYYFGSIVFGQYQRFEHYVSDAWCGMNHIVLCAKETLPAAKNYEELQCLGDKNFQISIHNRMNVQFLKTRDRIVRVIAGNRNVLLIVRE